ncbi:hypothetical protein Hanom_Chr02g00121151 [Helianthus anomalus]
MIINIQTLNNSQRLWNNHIMSRAISRLNVSTSSWVQGFSHRNCSIAQHHYLYYFGELSINKR